MRIGFVTPFNPAAFADRLGPSAPEIHQGATAVHILVAELLAAGHEIFIYTSYPGKGPVRRWAGDGLHVAAVPRSGRFPLPGKRVAVARRLRRILADDLMSRETPVPDVLHAQWTYDYALAAGTFAARIPTFCTVRDWAPYQFAMARDLKHRLYWAESILVTRRVLRNKAVHFVANSDYTRQLLREDDPAKAVRVIPNPIAKGSILTERTIYPDRPVLVSVCQSIDARKNIGTLLEAFRLYRRLRPTAELHLGGRDFVPGHPNLAPFGPLPEGVVLEGWLDRSALNALLDKASVLVQPSLEETFGNVLLEGMARRVAVVGGRDAGAVPAVLGHGAYGHLCDVTDPRALCDALVAAESRPCLDAATERLRTVYASDRIAALHLELYGEYAGPAAGDSASGNPGTERTN